MGMMFAEKLINFALNAGVSYHAEINHAVMNSGVDILLYAAAGIDYTSHACQYRIRGPLMSIYDGNTGLRVNLFWSIYRKIYGPGITER
jgi:hypothetical protein